MRFTKTKQCLLHVHTVFKLTISQMIKFQRGSREVHMSKNVDKCSLFSEGSRHCDIDRRYAMFDQGFADIYIETALLVKFTCLS